MDKMNGDWGRILRSRGALLALAIVVVLGGAVLAGTYMTGASSAAKPTIVAAATLQGARTPTAWQRPSPTSTATPEATATREPTPTSAIVSLATRSAAATGQAASAAPSEAPAGVTPQPTPALVPLDQLPPTPPFPEGLVGKILFRSNLYNNQDRIYAMAPDGSGAAWLANDWPFGPAEFRDSWSPDRYYRVAVGRNLETGQPRLEVRDGETGVPVSVIASGAVSAPAWSPVSDQVAFVSTEAGNEDIWVVSADGRGKKQLTSNKWASDNHPSWSPDGTQIVFTSNRGGKRQVWIMNADGTGQRLLSSEDYEAWNPVWVKYAQ